MEFYLKQKQQEQQNTCIAYIEQVHGKFSKYLFNSWMADDCEEIQNHLNIINAAKYMCVHIITNQISKIDSSLFQPRWDRIKWYFSKKKSVGNTWKCVRMHSTSMKWNCVCIVKIERNALDKDFNNSSGVVRAIYFSALKSTIIWVIRANQLHWANKSQ